MKKKNRDSIRIRILAAFLFVSICGTQPLCAQENAVSQNEAVKGFTMSIVDKGGKEKALIAGDTANLLPNGVVEVNNLVARIFGGGISNPDTIVHTAKGIYDRLRNTVTTDQFVRIDRRDVTITGTGLKWLPNRSKVVLLENLKVEYSAVDEFGVKIVTTITCRGNGILDCEKETVVFEKQVVISNPNAVLSANRVKVFFDKETQSIIRAEAYGGVKIKQPERESSSKRAIYYIKDDKIVLSGCPKIVQNKDLYTAERVTIYDKGNRVVFEPKAELIIYTETYRGDVKSES